MLVPDDHDVLFYDNMTSQLELHRQTPFVDRFQQSRSFVFVHFDRGPIYVVRHFRRFGKQRMHGSNREGRGNRDASPRLSQLPPVPSIPVSQQTLRKA
jgi:hypothetical protein